MEDSDKGEAVRRMSQRRTMGCALYIPRRDRAPGKVGLISYATVQRTVPAFPGSLRSSTAARNSQRRISTSDVASLPTQLAQSDAHGSRKRRVAGCFQRRQMFLHLRFEYFRVLPAPGRSQLRVDHQQYLRQLLSPGPGSGMAQTQFAMNLCCLLRVGRSRTLGLCHAGEVV